MSLPFCVPIRLQRGGKRLERRQFLQILDVLKAVHEHQMFNCDINPYNVLMLVNYRYYFARCLL